MTLDRVVRGALLVCWCAVLLLAAIAWLIPEEVAQSWAVDRAGNDDFSRFEAHGAAGAAVWFLRVAATVMGILLTAVWLRSRSSVPFQIQMLTEFWRAAAVAGSNDQPPAPMSKSIRPMATRLFIVAWLVLATYHAGASVNRRLWEWPLYRLYSGHTILPNISDSNREVIRYLAAATPPDAKILVLSDQKLFFLSYYLLPRRLYHPTHPDSEFVIPLPHNQRQLAAYRLADLGPDQIQRLQPDYILEYFEGSNFIEETDLEQDPVWVNFQRQRHGAAYRPKSLVVLRRNFAEVPR
jgi:hypothetical protein